MKFCPDCSCEKENADFYKDSTKPDGLDRACIVCRKIRFHKYKHRDYARNKKYRQNNKEKIRSQAKEYRLKNKDKIRLYRRTHTYGLSINEQINLFEKQDKCCCICKKQQNFNDRNLHLDHCHKTGTIRGFLCQRCNFMVGLIERQDNVLSNVIDYLK